MKSPLITLALTITLLNGCKQQNSSTEYGDTKYANSVDDTKIAYQIYGEGNMPLVFVHGWCCDKSYWNKQIEYFKKDYMVVAIDLAGHGESGMSRGNYTIQNFAYDVSAVINDLRLNNCILLGHSLGGRVVVEAATQVPDKIRAIFLVDSFKDYPESFEGEALDSIVDNSLQGWTITNFTEKSYNLIKSWYFPETDTTLQEWIATDMSSIEPGIGLSAARNMIIYHYSDLQLSLGKLGDIAMYSINARNDNDISKFRDNGVNFVESVKIDSVSHFLMMSPADKFNAILKDKLEKL
jgi:pimeloyl-ACP methyl ester carboxylesterase